MDEAPKSAYELAMERLKKKDADEGVAERALSEEQRAEIAGIRQSYAAKLAQEDILHKSAVSATFDPEERQKLAENYRRDVERLTYERDRKIEKVRGA